MGERLVRLELPHSPELTPSRYNVAEDRRYLAELGVESVYVTKVRHW